MEPVIIAVAITGSVPRKKDNPALPVTPAEQIDSTHEAFEAGASLVHIHGAMMMKAHPPIRSGLPPSRRASVNIVPT